MNLFIINQTKRADWNESKWVCLSSLLFLVPAYYSYCLFYYHYTFLTILAILFSINYWRDPLYSWRRTIDCVYAICFFIWITFLAIIYIRKTFLLISFWSLYCLLLYCNHMSGVLLGKYNTNWWKYHVVCHCCETYGLLVVFHCIVL